MTYLKIISYMIYDVKCIMSNINNQGRIIFDTLNVSVISPGKARVRPKILTHFPCPSVSCIDSKMDSSLFLRCEVNMLQISPEGQILHYVVHFIFT